jgi:hypothetical protein
MRKNIIIVFLLLFITVGLYPDDFSYEDNSFYFDEFISGILPGAGFFPFFFENYSPDLIYMIEESNGFSYMDNQKPYYEGESPIYFNWYLNGFNVSSSLNSGGSAILPPVSTTVLFDLKGETSFRTQNGMNFILNKYHKNTTNMNLSTVFPNMGSYVSFAPSLLSPHPSERSIALYRTRRKILSNNNISISGFIKFKNSSLSFDFGYYNIKRQFNDFNEYDSVFSGRGEVFSFITDYKKHNKEGSLELISAFTKKFRDNDFAEFGRLPQETYKKESFNFFTGVKIEYKGYNIKSSVLLENEKITPIVYDFSKELTDIDGDGFFPFERFGKFSAITIFSEGEKEYEFNKFSIKPFLRLRTSIILAKEESFDSNNISFQNKPYLSLQWYNPFEKYKTINNNISAGINFKYSSGDTMDINSNIYFKYGYLSFEDRARDIGLFNIGWDMGIRLFPQSKNKIFFSFGKIPYDLKENLNFFLESKRPFGKYFYTVSNENSDFSIGDLYKTTGAFFHIPDKNLKPPYSFRFLSLLSFKISKYFRFNIKTLYKKFKNNFWVKYGNYNGEYRDINGYDLYFQQNYAQNYILTNYDFKKEPFYGEFLMQIKGYKKNSWLFSFSFMAHMGMSYTSFGNGPIYNDMGTLDESMADPNSWINGFGRVDGDRAFAGKIFFGFYPFKNFSIGGSIKYRDGDPFAFINYYDTGKNIIFYYKTIQAENEKGIKGGPREDCVWDFSFKFKYNFNMGKAKVDIYLTIFNFLDLGSELSENVFSEGFRYANELQIPRSIRLGINVRF